MKKLNGIAWILALLTTWAIGFPASSTKAATPHTVKLECNGTNEAIFELVTYRKTQKLATCSQSSFEWPAIDNSKLWAIKVIHKGKVQYFGPMKAQPTSIEYSPDRYGKAPESIPGETVDIPWMKIDGAHLDEVEWADLKRWLEQDAGGR